MTPSSAYRASIVPTDHAPGLESHWAPSVAASHLGHPFRSASWTASRWCPRDSSYCWARSSGLLLLTPLSGYHHPLVKQWLGTAHRLAIKFRRNLSQIIRLGQVYENSGGLQVHDWLRSRSLSSSGWPSSPGLSATQAEEPTEPLEADHDPSLPSLESLMVVPFDYQASENFH